ncbi:MAG: DNA-binding HxlR family transcriptional regulator [Moritella sp.]|jgi:DNA-binding HxlR family transcriptional regulator
MTLPIPGEPVRGSSTGKPIMALFDLVGRTWCLGIIWQLGLVMKTDTGYGLTEQALALALLIKPMTPWAQSWADNLSAQLKSKDDSDA